MSQHRWIVELLLRPAAFLSDLRERHHIRPRRCVWSGLTAGWLGALATLAMEVWPTASSMAADPAVDIGLGVWSSLFGMVALASWC
jgi:hypothetical protein